jgi:hypothetical protein
VEQRLTDEVTRLRAEAAELPPGDLLSAIDEIAAFAETLLDKLRRNGTIEMLSSRPRLDAESDKPSS